MARTGSVATIKAVQRMLFTSAFRRSMKAGSLSKVRVEVEVNGIGQPDHISAQRRRPWNLRISGRWSLDLDAVIGPSKQLRGIGELDHRRLAANGLQGAERVSILHNVNGIGCPGNCISRQLNAEV